MNSEQFRRAADIFLQARALAPDARHAFLTQACEGDTALRAEVDRLLSASNLATPFPTLAKDLETLRERLQADVAAPGDHVGRYRIIEKLGDGGFGSVYVAEQEHPVRRRVALKVIKLGMDTKQVVARFEGERQALAMMDHANIAKVFDAGASEDGRPYFVMELVSGVPITSYCDANRLTAQQRLELFIPVCQAVQHAHQKGIIHRDLKPSNVLVSLQDGKPVPKVIDFGIAKATQSRLTEKTVFTESNQMIGTPEYMSPEQAEMSGHDVDTRSDIYSLGVLLYELLAGATPFDPRDLRSKAFAEMQRVIREVDPPKPSTRLSNLQAIASVAALRGTEPGKLRALVRGELDWIVMKCLEKDRTRRYETANGLADDVARYLANEPLNAGPPSSAYRLRKFVRRNRRGVAASAAMVLLLGSCTALYIQSIRREQAKTRQALHDAESANQSLKAVNDFLTDDILGAANPRVTHGKEISVKEALDKASESVSKSFANRPLIEADVRNTIAVTYQALGRADLGVPHARAALALRRKHLGDDHIDTLTSINHLGILTRALGQLDEAESLWRECLDRARRKYGPDDERTLLFSVNLSHLMEDRGKIDEAESLLREAISGFRRLFSDDHARTLVAMNRLAGLLTQQKKYDEAEKLYTETLERRRRTLGADHPDTIYTMSDFSLLRQNQGRFEEAESLLREAMETSRRVLGPDHSDTLVLVSNLAGVMTSRGRPADAEILLRQVLENYRAKLGADHPRTLAVTSQLSAALERQEKFADAESMIRDLLERTNRVHGPNHSRSVITASRHGTVLIKLGRYSEAEAPLKQAYEGMNRLPPPQRDPKQFAGVLSNLAEVCDHTQRPELANQYRRQRDTIISSATTSTAPASAPLSTQPN